MGFDCDTCAVIASIDKQSPDISIGVQEGEGLHKEQGAGDQGLMFGYATNETDELMPLPIILAHRLVSRQAAVREAGLVDFLRPDGKSQVTIEYRDNKPVRIDTVVLSSQHTPYVKHKRVQEVLIEEVAQKVLPAEMLKNTTYHVNPTGRFVMGASRGLRPDRPKNHC